MSLELLGMIQLGLLCIAIFVGFPTAITLLALGFFFGWAGFGWERVSNLMVSRYFFVMSNDVLIPVSLFIFSPYLSTPRAALTCRNAARWSEGRQAPSAWQGDR